MIHDRACGGHQSWENADGEPDVQEATEEEQAERRKARPGHGGKSRKVLEVEVGAEILPERKVVFDAKAGATAKSKAKPKAETKPKAKPKAEAKPETKNDTKAEAAPKEKKAKAAPKKVPPTAVSGSELDLSSIKLPNVGDLAAFLAQFDDDSDIKTLKARDSRKTAAVHYDARLAELSGAPKGKKG